MWDQDEIQRRIVALQEMIRIVTLEPEEPCSS